MKKLIVLLLALNMLGVFIAGCSGGDAAAGDDAAGGASKDPAAGDLANPDK
jgi:hypothetical protein